MRHLVVRAIAASLLTGLGVLASGSSSGVEAAAERSDWYRVLQRLDLRRADAFREADPALLHTVYAAGSSALAEDCAILAAYRQRGFHVSLRMALLEVRAVRRGVNRVVLDVVDRLAAAAVIDRAGQRTELPRDLPTARRITLVSTPDGWRVAAVRATR